MSIRMEKNEFLIKCSRQILAGMMTNTQKEPNTIMAVKYAESLWEELVAKNIVKDNETAG